MGAGDGEEGGQLVVAVRQAALQTANNKLCVCAVLLCCCAAAAVRIALLTFTSLGWRVPFRLHLLLQSINVGLLVVFGLHPYCNSKVRWL